MQKIRYTLLALYTLLLISGCEKEESTVDQQPDTLAAVFDSFYSAMAERYVFWDIDTTDWDAKRAYRQRFEQLDINNTADKLQATEIFRELTSSLIDHHYSISFQAAGITSVSVNPARERKLSQGLLQGSNSYPEVIALLQSPYYDVTFAGSTRLLTGKLDEQTLLLKVNQFQFVRNQSDANLESSLQWFLQEANNPAVQHVVLDLRSCIGGDLVDLDVILGALVSADITFGYTKYKQGRDPLSYSPLIPAVLHSTRTDETNVPQVIILTDSQTASLAEMIAYIVKSRGLGQIIGENTYGAFSPISDAEIFYSGDLVIGDFMTVRTSSVQFLGAQQESLEGVGIAPTVPTDDALAELVGYLR